jgi:hypothetical protein
MTADVQRRDQRNRDEPARAGRLVSITSIPKSGYFFFGGALSLPNPDSLPSTLLGQFGGLGAPPLPPCGAGAGGFAFFESPISLILAHPSGRAGVRD